MKKYIKKVIAVVFSFVIFGSSVFASTTTYDREDAENYGVDTSHYKVNSSNKQNILNTPYVDASEKVYDFGDLLDEEEEKSLFEMIDEFIEKYDMDLVLVTLNEYDSRSAMEYADDFFAYNSFGTNNTLDGALLLIDLYKREFWISTHGEAIRYYSDDRINSMKSSITTFAHDGDYYLAMKSFVTNASYYAASGITGKNANSHIDPVTGDIVYETKFNSSHILFGAIGSGIITIIFIAVASGKHRVIRKATQAKEYIVKDSFVLHQNEDKFLSTHTSKVYDPPSSSSSGGGGGSSTHSSSSGSSFGGGGGRF